MWQAAQGHCRAKEAALSSGGQRQVFCSSLSYLEEQPMYSCRRQGPERLNQGRLSGGGDGTGVAARGEYRAIGGSEVGAGTQEVHIN